MKKERFYKKKWFTILMLIFIAPVGIILLWVNKHWNSKTRIMLTIASIVFFIIVGVSSQQTDEEKAEEEAQQEQIKIEREEKKEQKDADKQEKADEKEAEKIKKEQEEQKKAEKSKKTKEEQKQKQKEKESSQDEKIKQKITKLAEDEHGVKINKIDVVKNHSDDVGDGYNALVHLVFDVKNRAKTARGAIDANTDRMGANLAGTDELENITFFWEVPYLHEGDNIVKINAKQDEGKMYRIDEWFDGRIFE